MAVYNAFRLRKGCNWHPKMNPVQRPSWLQLPPSSNRSCRSKRTPKLCSSLDPSKTKDGGLPNLGLQAATQSYEDRAKVCSAPSKPASIQTWLKTGTASPGQRGGVGYKAGYHEHKEDSAPQRVTSLPQGVSYRGRLAYVLLVIQGCCLVWLLPILSLC